VPSGDLRVAGRIIREINMGSKPSKPTASGDGASATGVRFGIPHAFMISVCIATAALLAPPDLQIPDVLLLLAGPAASALRSS
jgi:hypothetical protein